MEEINEVSAEKSRFFAVFLFFLALVYAISPVDIIPDVPVVGWIDDLIVLSYATYNLLNKALLSQNQNFQTFLQKLNWLIIIMGLLVVSCVGAVLLGFIRLFV